MLISLSTFLGLWLIILLAQIKSLQQSSLLSPLIPCLLVGYCSIITIIWCVSQDNYVDDNDNDNDINNETQQQCRCFIKVILVLSWMLLLIWLNALLIIISLSQPRIQSHLPQT